MPRGRRGGARGAPAVAAKGGRRGQHAAGSSSGGGGGNERVTRSSKAKLTNGLEDPAQVEKELNAQLRSMGLYAANITGDGNCLFRALSDQLYGFPAHHAELRQDVCDYLQEQAERFSGFIDVEKTFDEYVRTMRQSGTYGGHLELSAFAQLKQKEIKIVQPGLVYVVSAGGDDDSPQRIKERERKEQERGRAQANSMPGSEGPALTQRALRKMRREKKGVGTQALPSNGDAGPSALLHNGGVTSQADDAQSTESVEEVDKQTALASSSTTSASLTQAVTRPSTEPTAIPAEQSPEQIEAYGPLWIAYHNWEHYSSIRNVEGPHSGLPRIKEKIAGRMRGSAPPRVDVSDEEDPNPTEEEDLVLRSTRGYSLEQVRFYIKRHGGWEEALEAILAQEATSDNEDGGEGTNGSKPDVGYVSSDDKDADGAQTPSEASSPVPLDSSQATLHQIPTMMLHENRASLVPEHLRDWRNASPSSVDTNGTHSSVEGASTSTHATTDDAHDVASNTLPKAARGEMRRSKRTASKDHPVSSLRSSKRRSRSQSPLQQGLGAEDDAQDSEGMDAAHAIATMSVRSNENISRFGSENSASASPAPAHRDVRHMPVDPDKTPRQRGVSSMTTSANSNLGHNKNRTLTVRERREMRKAEKVRKALGTRARRQQELQERDLAMSRGRHRGIGSDGFEDEDDENVMHTSAANSNQTRGISAFKGHGADVKGFLELKI